MSDVAEEFGIDIRALPLTDIETNEYNPNELEESLFETLVEAVKSEGMNQPILVRPNPDEEGKFIVVDGENRFTAAKVAGLERIAVVVVPYDETQAKVRTLSYNAIKGQNVPIKLARLLVDLGKQYSEAEIRAMTGIGEDEQQSVLKLLKVPDFKPDTGVHITTDTVDRPIGVSLMLMPDEHGAYTAAMKKAMKLAGEDVTVLIGSEVADYTKAMSAAMGLAGMKLRNVALAAICKAFLDMPQDVQKRASEQIVKAMMDKRVSDAQQKQEQAEKSDKAKPSVVTRSMKSTLR